LTWSVDFFRHPTASPSYLSIAARSLGAHGLNDVAFGKPNSSVPSNDTFGKLNSDSTPQLATSSDAGLLVSSLSDLSDYYSPWFWSIFDHFWYFSKIILNV
jgi:hypothetical protein